MQPTEPSGQPTNHYAASQTPQTPDSTLAPAPTVTQPVNAQTQTQPTPETHSINSSGVIILQWLTYALWGWTVLALSALTASILANVINNTDTSSFTPYGIAAVLVLLPISLVLDVFYSKHEPQKKTGAAMIIMVIHAVLFAIFGIGSLIFFVFSVVELATSRTDTQGIYVSLYSCITIAIYYACVLLRTLNPVKLPWTRKAFKLFMLISVAAISVLGIIGPVANARTVRDDKLIEANISSIPSTINAYSRANSALPNSLSDLKLTGDAKQLVDRSLIKYTPNTNTSAGTGTSIVPKPKGATINNSYLVPAPASVYYYQLCATFKKQSSGYGKYSSASNQYIGTGDEYTTYISAYEHPSGEVCYKLKTEDTLVY